MIKFMAANYEAVAAFFLFSAFCIFLVHRGYDMRVNVEQKQSAHQEKVKNEIRNQPHSVELTVKRMQRGTF